MVLPRSPSPVFESSVRLGLGPLTGPRGSESACDPGRGQCPGDLQSSPRLLPLLLVTAVPLPEAGLNRPRASPRCCLKCVALHDSQVRKLQPGWVSALRGARGVCFRTTPELRRSRKILVLPWRLRPHERRLRCPTRRAAAALPGLGGFVPRAAAAELPPYERKTGSRAKLSFCKLPVL